LLTHCIKPALLTFMDENVMHIISIWKGQKEGDEWTAEETNEYLQSFVQ
jgi:hypothetical protein